MGFSSVASESWRWRAEGMSKEEDGYLPPAPHSAGGVSSALGKVSVIRVP